MTRKMKDIGIEWIGEIPESWSLNKLKNFYTFSKGKNANIYTKEYLGNYQGSYPVYSGQTENNGILGYLDTYEYDINQCLFTTTVGAKVMTLKILEGKFSLSQNCLIMIKHNEINQKYIYYYLESLFGYEKSRIPSYMQPSLRIEDLKKYTILFPTIKEQKKIANFLDMQTSLIDSIIEDTKQSIQELNQYKQSLITEIVTKGLDKNIDLKDSGIEWIGEYPSHWNVNKVNRLFEIKKDIANENGYDVLSVTQKGLKVKDITKNEGQMASDYSKYQIVHKDDFVMNHMDLLTGWVDCSIYEGVPSPDYRVFKNRNYRVANNSYYKYVFQACYTNRIFYGLGQGVSNLGRWRLQTDKFINFYLPIPPLVEQEAISQFLMKKEREIDELIAEKQNLISEYESYKKSMVYEYVTGKKEILS